MLTSKEEQKPALTQRQREIYEFLKDKILNRGYGPTVREIGNHFGIRSPNGVMCHLKALERKGLITREQHMSRAIQLAEPPQHRVTLPDAGLLNGSGPLRPGAESERVDFASLFDTEGNCCVRIDGDAMKDGGIYDGDYLVVNRFADARNGDVILAKLPDDQTIVRRVRSESGETRFESIGTTDTSSQPAGAAQIVGVVVAVIRRF